MEAMATALPVISTHVDGQVEIMEHGSSGWLIPPHDITALADAILRLERNPIEMRRMGIAARQRMQRHFEAEHHTRQLSELLLRAGKGSSIEKRRHAYV
jgi:L-malate glycosyltransferase